MSGTTSAFNNGDIYSQYPSIFLSLIRCLPSLHLLILSQSPIWSVWQLFFPLGHFLIPPAHIQVLPSSIKPHSSNLLSLYPHPPTQSPHPAAFLDNCVNLSSQLFNTNSMNVYILLKDSLLIFLYLYVLMYSEPFISHLEYTTKQNVHMFILSILKTATAMCYY